MADSKTPLGPRTNPLFEGSHPSSVAPSWTRKSSNTQSSSFHFPQPATASATATATATDSSPLDPLSDPLSEPSFSPPPYDVPSSEHPAYSVETPGSSPYHPPPYYVNTPATSDRGSFTPYSSAPSSPRRRLGDFHLGGGFSTDKDEGEFHSPLKGGSSGFSFRKNHTRRTWSIEEGARYVGGKDGEFPDHERDTQRRVKKYTCIIWSTILSLVALSGVTLLILWSIFQPVAPKFNLLGVAVNNLSLNLTAYDSFGVSTYAMSGDVSISYSVHNPNIRFALHHDNSAVQVGYGKLTSALSATVAAFDQSFGQGTNVSVSAIGDSYALYGAGPILQDSIDSQQYIPLTLSATFYSHVNVIWKLLVIDFIKDYSCIVGFNSTDYSVVNSTCTSPTNSYAFDS